MLHLLHTYRRSPSVWGLLVYPVHISFSMHNRCAASPAPESNQSDSGQVRLLKPAIIHTHSALAFCVFYNSYAGYTQETIFHI